MHPREEHPGQQEVVHHRQGLRAGRRVLQGRPQEDRVLEHQERGRAHLGMRGREEEQDMDEARSEILH